MALSSTIRTWIILRLRIGAVPMRHGLMCGGMAHHSYGVFVRLLATANFRELATCELRGTLLPRTPVNKGKKKGRQYLGPDPDTPTPLSAIRDHRRGRRPGLLRACRGPSDSAPTLIRAVSERSRMD